MKVQAIQRPSAHLRSISREAANEMPVALIQRCSGRNRRLAKDFEATIDSARAFLYAASVMLLVRRMSSFMTFETDSKVNNSLTTRPHCAQHATAPNNLNETNERLLTAAKKNPNRKDV